MKKIFALMVVASLGLFSMGCEKKVEPPKTEPPKTDATTPAPEETPPAPTTPDKPAE